MAEAIPTPSCARDLSLVPGTALAVLVPHSGLCAAAARAKVRTLAQALLARWIGCHTSCLRIVRSAAGKPRLAAPVELWFNVSHGAGCSLLAFSRCGEIGCDVEDRLRPTDVLRLHDVVLHPGERSHIHRLPAHRKAAGFARCWTRKKALLKAQGTGFMVDATGIDVRPGLEQPVVLLEALGAFTLHDGTAHDGAPAAVACLERHCEWRVLEG